MESIASQIPYLGCFHRTFAKVTALNENTNGITSVAQPEEPTQVWATGISPLGTIHTALPLPSEALLWQKLQMAPHQLLNLRCLFRVEQLIHPLWGLSLRPYIYHQKLYCERNYKWHYTSCSIWDAIRSFIVSIVFNQIVLAASSNELIPIRAIIIVLLYLGYNKNSIPIAIAPTRYCFQMIYFMEKRSYVLSTCKETMDK